MALAFMIKKAAYDKLSDEMKAEYIAGDKDGEFVLDVSGLPEPEDVGPIKRALESEKSKYKTLKADRDALKLKVDEAPDVEALEAKHATDMAKLKTFTEKTLLDGTATGLAGKISTVPALMAKAIKERLVVDMTGDEPAVKILGKDGKPSDLTIDKLGEEFVANADYKAIVIASKASGGGAPKPPIKPLGGGAPKVGEQGDEAKPFDFANATPQALAAHIGERKAAEAEAAAQQ